MNITEVRVFPVDEDKLKAFASIVIDDQFVVSDIKIIHGKNGRFLSMPSTKRKNGSFRDIAHPLDQATREMIEQEVFGRYDEVLASENRALVREVLEESGGVGGPAAGRSSRRAPAAAVARQVAAER